jgi:hypothetical protein
MATFPTAVISLTNPTSTSKLNSPDHATQHINANDEIEAIETEFGVNPAGGHSTVVDRLDNVDTYRCILAFTTSEDTTKWIVAPPFAASLSGKVVCSVSSGTGRLVAVAHGSAGDDAIAIPATGVTGTIGAVVTMVASATATCTASECLRLVTGSCATAQVYGVTVVFAKTDTV